MSRYKSLSWNRVSKQGFPGFRPGTTQQVLQTVVIIAIMVFLQTTETARAADGSVVALVREGIRQYFAGDYEQAEKQFAQAGAAEPENLTIVYDHACSLARSGDSDKAKELFQKSAMSRNLKIAADSHYNLGCLVAEQGRAALGSEPIDATQEQRQRGISLLLTAVAHYRDCLKLDPAHSNARHNLELIRMFIKHIQSQWDQKDRAQQREGKDLLQLLKMIESKQETLRATTRQLNQQPVGPERSAQAKLASEQQQSLSEEIEPLKAKIDEELSAAMQQLQPATTSGSSATGTTPVSPPVATATASDEQLQQIQAAQQLLTQMADQAGQQMTAATEQLNTSSFVPASQSQRQALDQLNQIYLAIAPFTEILQRAVQQQQKLTEQSPAARDTTDSAATDPTSMTATSTNAETKNIVQTDTERSPAATETPDTATPDTATPDTATPDATTSQTTTPDAATPDTEIQDRINSQKTIATEFDFEEAVWQQNRVSDWSRMLSLKAESELPALESQLAAMPAATTDSESTDPLPDKDPTTDQSPNEPSRDDLPAPEQDGQEDPMAQQAAQMQAMAKALRKAIELAPQVVEHSDHASQHLQDTNAQAALPKQQQALDLLRQIAESLPKQDQDQQGDQQQDQTDQQQDNQQQNQDQTDQQQDNQQQDNQQQDQGDQQDKSQSDQSQPDQSQSEGKSPEEQQQPQNGQQSPEERAMSILRRAREREQQHRDLQKQIQKIIGGRAPVEKDW